MKKLMVLTPAQQAACDYLSDAIAAGDVAILRGNCGMGKSTILETLQQKTGGAILGLKKFIEVLNAREPWAFEESFLEALKHAFSTNDVVFVDDLHLITNVTEGSDYPRPKLLDAVLIAVLDDAASRGKKVVFAADEADAPWQIRERAFAHDIGKFQPEDFASFFQSHLGTEAAAELNATQIYRFAPLLSGHQLKNGCRWLRQQHEIGTDAFIDYISSQNLATNVDIEEVAAVDWKDLKGMDDVIQALEAKIALPFENHALTAELRLKPKRGVLLAGPPGTGKTTIGRALAHRLKSKFFLIDGTVIAGTTDFYRDVRRIFDAAKKNAPSIIFIDDTDVIFEGKGENGLYRYLLTMLDGLESASAERVCVMMTAMDASSLPIAMLRSGRLELWLETRLPDMEARIAIIRERLADLPAPLDATDVEVVAEASHGLTGADLKALIEDGKLLFAHDKLNGKTFRPAEEYFLEAIETVRANRRNYRRPKTAQFMETFKIGYLSE